MANNAYILLRSSGIGLAGFMRRLLTGYAISYNRCHRRRGYRFQNRITRRLGVSTSAISKIVKRADWFFNLVNYIPFLEYAESTIWYNFFAIILI
jgi:hypothetical protein